MKAVKLFVGFVLALIFGFVQAQVPSQPNIDLTPVMTPAQTLSTSQKAVGTAQFTAANYMNDKPVLHVVAFRYKPTTNPIQREKIRNEFLNLKNTVQRSNTVPYPIDIQVGSQNSGEVVDQAIDDVFIVTFCSQGDRNHYVGQPVVADPYYYDASHQKFKDFAGPFLADVIVLDFTLEQTTSKAITDATCNTTPKAVSSKSSHRFIEP